MTASGQKLYASGPYPGQSSDSSHGTLPGGPSRPPRPPADGAPVYTSGPPGVVGQPAVDAEPAPAQDRASYRPAAGELGIKERRSWKTWQALVAILVAIGVGAWWNGSTGSASGSGQGAGSSAYKAPPPSGSTATTSGTATSTTVAGAPAPTTSPTVAPAAGPDVVLVPQQTSQGNWTSSAFTVAAGTWKIGWAYQCTPAPSASPAFQIFVVQAGAGAGSSAAVTGTTGSGQDVTPETTAGSQQIIVQTQPNCRWAVKVTGYGGG